MGQCNCEHGDHEQGTAHPYLQQRTIEARAMYVGDICLDCARDHLSDYLILSPLSVAIIEALRGS